MKAHFSDADGTSGTSTFRYAKYDESGTVITPQPCDGVTPLYLHGTDADRDELIEAIFAASADVHLIDLPATSQTVLVNMDAELSFAKVLAEQDIELTCVTVVEPTMESLTNLTPSLDLFPSASHVFALNEKLGSRDEGAYVIYDGDPLEGIPTSTAKQRLAALGDRGAEIVIPKIAARPLVIASQYMIPFGAAVYDQRIRRANRMKIASWLAKAEEAMRPADHLLGLVPSDRPRVILVISDKGGVGKSTFAALLWERLLREAYGVTYGSDDSTDGAA